MPEINLVVVATFAAQTVAAIIMAILLLGFLRQYRKSYLRHWTLSWTALALHQLFTGIGLTLALRFHFASNHPLRLITASLSGVAGYLQITWLLFGVYEILRRRPVRIRTYWRTVFAVAALALVPSLLFVGPDVVSNLRYFTRLGLPALISSVAYLVASYAFWQSRDRRRGVGFTMIAVSFFLYALEEIHRFGISTAWSRPTGSSDTAGS